MFSPTDTSHKRSKHYTLDQRHIKTMHLWLQNEGCSTVINQY